MDKRILYVCEYDNYGVKFYFFYDESNNKWVGGVESKENSNSVEDFIAAAKIFGTELLKTDIVESDMYGITGGEPIYNFSRDEIIHTPVKINLDKLLSEYHHVRIVSELPLFGDKDIVYVVGVPVVPDDEGYIDGYIYDTNHIAHKVKYNLDYRKIKSMN